VEAKGEKRMKIAIDARIINTSTGRYVERLLHYLEEVDKVNDYYILVPKKDLAFYKPRSPKFKVIEADFANYSLAEQLGLLKLLNQLRPDLVHFCMPQQPVLYRGTHVTTVHDLTLLNTYNSDKNYVVYKIKQLIGRFVFRHVAHSSARIITPSKYTRDAYVAFAGVSPDKVAVTYEGSDVSTVKPKAYKQLEGKKFLMYVGQQSGYKNIRRLIQAHQQLRQDHPDLLLVFVGRLSGRNGAPLVTNREWAQAQGCQGIIYTDFLPDEQLLWLYQHCATYVFPSLMEGFGLPGLEAMAAGAPVASSNATCLPEVYKDAAHYFDPINVDDMVSKINAVLTDSKLRSTLLANGKKVVARYSWKRMAEQTLDVYNQAT
jgi:glycosyltransferase involved in cell wall biosynthesis